MRGAMCQVWSVGNGVSGKERLEGCVRFVALGVDGGEMGEGCGVWEGGGGE